MMKPEVINMGCRLNLAESHALAEQLSTEDNLVIINSCAVTNEAVRQTRQAIRQARKRRPDARIVVTGCAAQVEPDRFAAMPEIDVVLGNVEKETPALFGHGLNERVRVSDIMAVRETAPHLATAFDGKTRAFVQVQTGCDHRCTFCIIPFGRGNSRSVPAGQVVDHIKRLVDSGCNEVVLTGVDVTSYGHDLPGVPNLGLLVERILRHVPTLLRLRLSSVDGVEIDDRLFALLTQETRLMPHVHLSLQSGDDLILKRMKRRHSRSQAIDIVARMKDARPDIAIGADIIAGFPTEDDAMFANSLEIIDKCDIVHGHIFPYSPKIGTPAERMPQVSPAIIKARAAELRKRVAERHGHWLMAQIGSTKSVLVEKSGHNGHAEDFALVNFETAAEPGTIRMVHITGQNDAKLLGVFSA